ncbi:MAG TPA: type II toxin-antitoxin system prevent-host-death family antitoxin [Desulfobacterales bacterium]|nr:type II toxin-antitoxin system prevent-host-death family antitoxin [Desulfobacterales bacterium]
MLEINVKEARSNFSQLLNKVEQGQDILLIRRGKKVARLVSPETDCNLPSLGEFRRTIALSGEELSSVVLTDRNKERY